MGFGRVSLLGLLLGACNGDGKESDDPLTGAPPEIAGHYNVIISAATGCGEDGEAWFQEWAEGPLLVEGTEGDLSFDFGDDYVFLGSVSYSMAFSFGGDIVYNDAELEVYSSGTVSSETYSTTDGGTGYRWMLDGDFEIIVDDDEFETNNCTVEGPYQATQL